jgi:hypothetical protein
MLEKTKGSIMNGQFRDSNNIGHNSRKSKKDRQYNRQGNICATFWSLPIVLFFSNSFNSLSIMFILLSAEGPEFTPSFMCQKEKHRDGDTCRYLKQVPLSYIYNDSLSTCIPTLY